jgi:hypothetical protein
MSIKGTRLFFTNSTSRQNVIPLDLHHARPTCQRMPSLPTSPLALYAKTFVPPGGVKCLGISFEATALSRDFKMFLIIVSSIIPKHMCPSVLALSHITNYKDNVQNTRQDVSRILTSNIVKDTAGDDTKNSKKNSINVERPFNALQKHVNVAMDEQACSEVRAGLDAYYKVPKQQLSSCKRKLIRCRSRSRHSSTKCANKSSNDTFFARFQRSSHLKL